VLAASGSGAEGDILAGVAWALGQGCKVVSMSLGRAVAAGTPFSPIFENAAQRGLRQGTLIVAASGNDSRRDLGVVNPVSHPANCPSVMAVAAVDSALDVTYFSNGGVAGTNGGAVDIAAPGLNVLSSWPAPTLYNTISGTSMATPHVAGLAALYAEANPSAGPKELWGMITQHARLLSVPSGDVGAGLAQAP
jgi:subtilisin family serine protease